jgi:ABC-type transporter Mla MlaB component
LELILRERVPAGEAIKHWLLLLDLYRLVGNRERFEQLALEFARRFERSAPVWQESNSAGGAAGQIADINLGARLAAGPALEQLSKAIEQKRAVRLELGRVTAIEGTATLTLAGQLTRARRAGCRIELLGCEAMLELLRSYTNHADDRASWALLLELLQFLGAQERFEEAALQYAMTYEVSPPSWEASALAPLAGVSERVVADEFALRGELLSGAEQPLRELREFAAERTELSLNLAALTRIDFASAGCLSNVLRAFKQAGKRVTIRGAAEPIGVLLAAVGATHCATFT